MLDVKSVVANPVAPPTSRVAWFGDVSVAFDDRVLAPRAWTILQSEWAIELLADLGPGRILELCAGVGHIGLVAALRSGRSLVQVESDPVAAQYARRNAQCARMARRVFVRCGDIDTMLGDSETFPLILADPPYLTSDQTRGFPDDPVQAVDGGRDGLAVMRRTLRVAADHLAGNGACLMQVRDERQADEIAAWVEKVGMNLRRCGQRLVEQGGVVLMRKVVERW